MSATLRITANPRRVSMVASIHAAAKVSPLLVLTGRALADLVAELGGGHDGALRFLLGLAEANSKPIGVNLPSPDGSSRTIFIAPRDWSDERLRGWIAGHHRELEATFGEVARVAPTSRRDERQDRGR